MAALLDVAAAEAEVAELEAVEIEVELELLEEERLAHSSFWRLSAACCSAVVQLAERHF